MATKEGTSHLTLHLTSGLELRLLVAINAAGGDERPDAGQRSAHASAKQQARPVGRIEKGIPEFAGLVARARDADPGVAGREHEGENAVDDDERADRGARVDPADRRCSLASILFHV